MAKKLPISEVFSSLEGEGPFTNRPTIYARFGGCNLKCPGFNNKHNIITTDGYAPLTFTPADYTRLEDLPLIEMGCDSQYAVNTAFKHMWRNITVEELLQEVTAMLPGGKWNHPDTQLPYIFSLTGGEPTLRWKFFEEILNHPLMVECRHVLVETNCTVPFKSELIDVVRKWLDGDSSRIWTWSNSPKLSASGELWSDSIKPAIAELQQQLVTSHPHQVNQYFKFVCDDVEADYQEVAKAMAEFRAGGIRQDAPVWVMPMACTDSQQNAIARGVATKCIEAGWGFNFRVQNEIWGNGVGT